MIPNIWKNDEKWKMFQATNQRNKLSLAASDSFPFTTHLNLSPTKVEAVLWICFRKIWNLSWFIHATMVWIMKEKLSVYVCQILKRLVAWRQDFPAVRGLHTFPLWDSPNGLPFGDGLNPTHKNGKSLEMAYGSGVYHIPMIYSSCIVVGYTYITKPYKPLLPMYIYIRL